MNNVYGNLVVALLSRLDGDLLISPDSYEEIEQRVAIAVCAVPGMTPRYWQQLNEIERIPWLRKLLAQNGGNSGNEAPASSVEPNKHLLDVALEKMTITLDGVEFDVKSVQALRWVNVLADHPGEWISGKDLADHDDGLVDVRTDKLKTQLPDAIQNLIDSRTGAGSRLSLRRS